VAHQNNSLAQKSKFGPNHGVAVLFCYTAVTALTEFYLLHRCYPIYGSFTEGFWYDCFRRGLRLALGATMQLVLRLAFVTFTAAFTASAFGKSAGAATVGPWNWSSSIYVSASDAGFTNTFTQNYVTQANDTQTVTSPLKDASATGQLLESGLPSIEAIATANGAGAQALVQGSLTYQFVVLPAANSLATTEGLNVNGYLAVQGGDLSGSVASVEISGAVITGPRISTSINTGSISLNQTDFFLTDVVYTISLLAGAHVQAGGSISAIADPVLTPVDPGFTIVFSDGILNEFPPSETPLPAALPLFATGLGGLGLLGWRRKRSAALW
jgi:hypothetical protein